MAHLDSNDEIEPQRIELAETGQSLGSPLEHHTSSSRSSSVLFSLKDDADDEDAFQSDVVYRLPTSEGLRSSSLNENQGSKVDIERKRVIDVAKAGALERQPSIVEKLIKHVENDNLLLLQKIRKRIDKVGVELPKVVVRYNNLRVQAECDVVHGKPLPTLWNSLKIIFSDSSKLICLKKQAVVNIIDDFRGIIKPGRMTLLLGPPGCGKTTLLKLLSGNLDKSLKATGEVYYNGYKLEDCVPQKTSAYISQNDLHIPEMTVREALDFSARCQGVGSLAEIMAEVSRREKQAKVVPDPDIDTYMKAISIEGQKTTLQTDYILKILGLDICADTPVGDAMRRGVSGGEKKRLTTGEMIIGPTKALFMDEISNGLDSSTTYQVIVCLQQLAHIANATVLMGLLQPAPETFDLFDDIILMAEGKIVYHGPRSHVLEFFEDCGFRCPERKGVADFLQEVISRKDQAQYWHQAERSYSYISVDMFSKKFKESTYGKKLDDELSHPFMNCRHRSAISFNTYSLSKWELFKACMSRELLLMRRNYFLYIFKSAQLTMTASITMTIFLRRGKGIDIIHANRFLGAVFLALVVIFFDGISELSLTVQRLAVFYKQRDLRFYPAWSYAISSTILKVPLSLLAALIWTSLTYYAIGYSPEPGRFFRHLILLFALHLVATSMFRFLASVFRTTVAASTGGFLSIKFFFFFGGFILPKPSIPTWLRWGFWISPFTYGQIGLSVNEFLAPRWQNILAGNTTLGNEALEIRGFEFSGYFFWISFGALLGFAILFNIGFTLAVTFLNPPRSRAIISDEKFSQIQGSKDSYTKASKEPKWKTTSTPQKDQVALPFKPLSLTFKDVQYSVEIREKGLNEKRLQLLCDITGALKPGVLTALMGVSGAGKTTLLDVLAGRKTSGTIEGDIRIGGHPKKFVREVLEIIELDEIRDCLVGMPGVSGLSTEQRKRLTIAVELVANPSIIFMDEPTTGLDARTAAIIMRAIKNVADTGRTIVCTIHQPSIDIFEAFDEDVSGVPKIRNNYNPATWMLEVTSTSAEAELGIDFAQIYKNSVLSKNNRALVNSLSIPPDSKELHFATRFSQNGWGQFKSCLWKQHLSYWRNPSYTLMRYMYSLISSLVFGILFWDKGTKIDNQQSLFNVLGAIATVVFFTGVNNCSSVLPYVSTERSVLYRERFAGMYASWAYALAQVTIEVPYLFLQAMVVVIITYPMVGFYWSTVKVFWYFYALFCTMTYYTFLGMLLIAVTPSFPVAAVLQSPFFTMFNLFAGFFIPQPEKNLSGINHRGGRRALLRWWTKEEDELTQQRWREKSAIGGGRKSWYPKFVREVLEIIELDEIMDCLVGISGVSGLSTEQRKRLTIAVELVANPSIIFMDEPATGLDARAAAIVMRAVKNVANTERTIVCTIHHRVLTYLKHLMR
ncbi:hypothetical protein Vadar_029098 [Vaccinium darrowii]|uniref:Uncharacterized protein n=1 Tax=Vaccinium darrowii TaxID=229202 RepID=A0ACB7X558_9ERIC|nr:hypothetical protein Vadar_029098 [Vaccinium darrowii]